MSIILATNNIADVGGNPIKDTTAGRFRSTHVGYGIATEGTSSHTPVATAEFKHAPVGGDVTWIHCKIWHSHNVGANNGTGAFWCAIRDASNALICDFDLDFSPDVHVTLFGASTVNYTPAGNRNPYNSVATIGDVDIKLTVSVATLTVEVYIDGGEYPYFNLTVANNGKTAPVFEEWRCFDWLDTNVTVRQVISEYIVADEDTRGLGLTDKFTLADGVNTWTGDVADLFDENVSTGMTADALGKRVTQAVTAYGGPGASVTRAVVITAYGDVDGADGDVRGAARANDQDFFTGNAGLKNGIPESRSVAFDTNPIDSSAWLEADFTDFEFGIEASS